MRASQSRLIGSALTPENINNEIAADFLTKLFTNPKLMEELAQNDLDLAKDRYGKGLSTSAIEASSGEDKVNMNGIADKTFIQKAQSFYNELERGFVDYL